MKPINIKNKFMKFDDLWSPRVIADLNDYQIKLAKVEGEFVRHNHKDTDELFYVVSGRLFIEFDDETLELNAGEMFVVPKGEYHRPFANGIAEIMIIEPRGVINTGDSDEIGNAENDIYI